MDLIRELGAAVVHARNDPMLNGIATLIGLTAIAVTIASAVILQWFISRAGDRLKDKAGKPK
jgi:hypothetical protein